MVADFAFGRFDDLAMLNSPGAQSCHHPMRLEKCCSSAPALIGLFHAILASRLQQCRERRRFRADRTQWASGPETSKRATRINRGRFVGKANVIKQKKVILNLEPRRRQEPAVWFGC